MIEKLYTLEEIAQILGITHRTAWQYIKDGKLQGVKAKGWRVSESNLNAFLNGQTPKQ